MWSVNGGVASGHLAIRSKNKSLCSESNTSRWYTLNYTLILAVFSEYKISSLMKNCSSYWNTLSLGKMRNYYWPDISWVKVRIGRLQLEWTGFPDTIFLVDDFYVWFQRRSRRRWCSQRAEWVCSIKSHRGLSHKSRVYKDVQESRMLVKHEKRNCGHTITEGQCILILRSRLWYLIFQVLDQNSLVFYWNGR